MKKIVILCGNNCGYCKKAKMLTNRVLEKEPSLLCIDIRYIQDDTDIGKQFEHTLVPAFFCNGTLVFEGNPDIDTVTKILNNCYD